VPFALVALLLGFVSGHVLSTRGVALGRRVGRGRVRTRVQLVVPGAPRAHRDARRVLQLLVPVLAAAAGVALLGEDVTLRLVIAGVMILGGVATAVLTRRKRAVAVPGRT
jgi:hypothetical protein